MFSLIFWSLCVIVWACILFGWWGIPIGITVLILTFIWAEKHPDKKYKHDIFDSYVNGEDIQSTHCGEIWNDKFKL